MFHARVLVPACITATVHLILDVVHIEHLAQSFKCRREDLKSVQRCLLLFLQLHVHVSKSRNSHNLLVVGIHPYSARVLHSSSGMQP